MSIHLSHWLQDLCFLCVLPLPLLLLLRAVSQNCVLLTRFRIHQLFMSPQAPDQDYRMSSDWLQADPSWWRFGKFLSPVLDHFGFRAIAWASYCCPQFLQAKSSVRPAVVHHWARHYSHSCCRRLCLASWLALVAGSSKLPSLGSFDLWSGHWAVHRHHRCRVLLVFQKHFNEQSIMDLLMVKVGLRCCLHKVQGM